MRYPDPFIRLMQLFKKFPGVGHKSAERFAFHILSSPPGQIQEFVHLIQNIQKEILPCSICGCLIQEDNCPFCKGKDRNHSVLCVVAHAKDVFSLEGTNQYNGLYHVLGGMLSPLDHRGPRHLSLPVLLSRISKLSLEELIIALDATVEGDATALFIREEIKKDFPNLQVTKLASGIPMGSSFDSVDGGTLMCAFFGRQTYRS